MAHGAKPVVDPWLIDYYELLAVEKSWLPWWFGWRPWPLIFIGDDEYMRRTIVIGPVCFPLWRCRCSECAQLLAELRARVDQPDGA